MRLSMVLPAYNEADIAADSVRQVHGWLSDRGEPFEIIVSDDGSDDATSAVVEALALDTVRVVRQAHGGKGSALTAGFKQASGEYVGFIDIDLEIPVHHLSDCIRALDSGADAAIGSKVLSREEARRRPMRRRITTFGFNLLARRLFGTAIGDHQAGLKLFRRQALAGILDSIHSSGWLWDTEVLALLIRRGATITEVPITTRHVRPGHVSVIKTTAEMFLDLVRLRRTLGS